MTEHIYNGEEGLAVRDKLNEIIDRVNSLNNVEDHANTIGNPHNTYASQVKQTNEPLGPNVQTALNDLDSRQRSLQGQWDAHNNAVNPDNLVAADIPQSNKMLGENVQYALNDLVGLVSEVQQLLDDKADLHHIDGNRTKIQLYRGTNVPEMNIPDSLMIAELWCHYTQGELWTKLTDGSIVMIGSKDFMMDAPKDGKTYARKDGEWVEVSATIVGDVPPVEPIVGTLWYDTGSTAELYVWDGTNWISMTGAGGGGAASADNVVLDDADGTMRNVALAREINTEGDGFWRQIYTSDIVTENNQPMFGGRADDGIRNQKDANWHLLDLIEALPDTIISDRAPEDPKNEDLWFDNTEDVMQLFIWHEESDAWIPVAPPTTLEGRVAAGETTQAAIIAQIQKSLEDQAGLADRITAGEAEQSTLKNKVNALEGAVGEHSLVFTMDNSNPREGEFNLKDGAMQITNTLASADYITLSDTDRNGNPIDLDRVTEGDVLRFSSIDGQVAELKITDGTLGVFAFTKVSGELDRLSEYPYDFVLLSSFDPAGLATKDYVDARDKTKIGRRAIWTLENDTPWILRQDKLDGEKKEFIKIHDGKMNLTNVGTPGSPSEAATKAYVDQEVSRAIANLPSASAAPRPAQLSWLYSSMTTGAPSTGAFMFNGTNWRFSLKTWCGGDGFWITETAERSWNTSHLCEMSIWMKDGMQWKMVKHVEIEKVYWPTKSNDKAYISFTQKWQSNDTTLKSNTEYFVTVGGFF